MLSLFCLVKAFDIQKAKCFSIAVFIKQFDGEARGLKFVEFNRKSYKCKCVVFIHPFSRSILKVYTVLGKLKLFIYNFLRISAYIFYTVILNKFKIKIVMSGFNATTS